MKMVWNWMKTHIWPTIAAFFAGLAVITGVMFLIQRKAASKARDEVRIAAVRAKIEAFQARSKAIEEIVDHDEVVVERLSQEREELKVEVIEARDVSGLTDEEMLDAYAKLGY